MSNKIVISVILLMQGIVLVGCSSAAMMITAKSQSEKTGVFTEVMDAGMPPQGFADVIVKANIKTHEAGYYIGESSKSPHGKPGYPFVLNIDEQAAVWKVDGKKEALPQYDEHGKTSGNPEAGAGIKYVLEKKLRVRPGSYKLFFGLPEDNYFLESSVTMKEGETTVIDYKPVYRYKTIPTRIPTFLKGISHYEAYLNGNKIK